MGVFDEYRKFDHWITPNIGGVWGTYREMLDATPGTDRHERLLTEFRDAAESMSAFEHVLFDGLRKKHLDERPDPTEGD